MAKHLPVCGIYAIYQGSRERYAYVGSTANLAQRQYDHKRKLRCGKHRNPRLQNTWNKYGADDFYFTVLEQCPNERLIEQEQYWLDTLQPTCNIAVCSDNPVRGRKLSAERRAAIAATMAVVMLGNQNLLGHTHSEESRAKMSSARMGNTYNLGHKASTETRAKMSAARLGNTNTLGYKHTEEARAKMSAARKGKPKSAETRARMSAARRARPSKKKQDAG